MRRFAPIVVVVIVGQLLAACSSRGLGPGEARLTISGRAQVAGPGQAWQDAHSGRTLHRGERLQVLSGLAQVHMSKDRLVELRRGSQLELQPTPVLLKGDALATAKDVELAVDAGAAGARVRKGAAHVTRGLATEAASYAGDVDVESAGRQLTVPALRQAAVPGPGLVTAPVPLDYRPDNPWDRRYLGDAIELGDELQARSQGFTAQLAPTEGHTAGFYRQLLPDLDSERAFDQGLIDPTTTPGDTLVGAAIAVESRRGTFTDRWRGVFEFRAQGARWGLVALDQKVTRAPLLSAVDAALGRLGGGGGGGGVAAGPLGGGAGPLGGLTGPVPAPGGPSAPGPGQGPGGGGANGGGGGGGSPTTTLLPPAPAPPPGLLPPLLPGPGNGGGGPTTTTTPPGPVGGLVQGVGNAVGGLLGGLLGRN